LIILVLNQKGEVGKTTLSISLAIAGIARPAVPDLPDRIIAATALHCRVPLVTRDKNIRACGSETI